MKYVLFGLVVLLMGCGGALPDTNTPNKSADIRGSAKVIDVQSKNIESNAIGIKTNVLRLEPSLAPDEKLIATDIGLAADRIIASTIEIRSQSPVLNNAANASDKIEKERDGWKSSYESEKKKNESGIQSFLLYVAGIASIILIGSVLVFIFTDFKKTALMTMIGAGVVFGCAIFLHQYWQAIAIAAGVVMTLGLGALVYMVWKNRKEIFAKKTAAVKLVNLIDVIKTELDKIGKKGMTLKDKLFADGGVADVVLRSDDETIRTVKSIRNKK